MEGAVPVKSDSMVKYTAKKKLWNCPAIIYGDSVVCVGLVAWKLLV